MRIVSVLSITIISVTLFLGCAVSPLHRAIVLNDTNNAVELIKHDKSVVSKENDKGRTPLVVAVIYSREELIRSILEAGADPNQVSTDGSTALTEAAYKGILSIIELMLKYGAKVDLPQKQGWTPVLFAVNQNNYPATKLLIKNSANVNKKNDKGATPLQLASMNGHTAITRLLLEHGANPDLQDNDGKTPLMLAALGGYKAIAEELLFKGAHTDLLSKDNKKAKDLAEEKGFVELSDLLKNDFSKRDVSLEKTGNKPQVIFTKIESKLDGDETPPYSVRALELRTAVGHFLDMLCESGQFGQIDTLDDANNNQNALYVSLTIHETEDRNIGSNVSNALLSGFLTLGIVPPSADYGYRSEMTLFAEWPDGRKKEFNATSDTSVSLRGDPRTSAYLKKSRSAKESARKLVTHQAFELLISQVETDSFIRGK